LILGNTRESVQRLDRDEVRLARRFRTSAHQHLFGYLVSWIGSLLILIVKSMLLPNLLNSDNCLAALLVELIEKLVDVGLEFGFEFFDSEPGSPLIIEIVAIEHEKGQLEELPVVVLPGLAACPGLPLLPDQQVVGKLDFAVLISNDIPECDGGGKHVHGVHILDGLDDGPQSVEHSLRIQLLATGLRRQVEAVVLVVHAHPALVLDHFMHSQQVGVAQTFEALQPGAGIQLAVQEFLRGEFVDDHEPVFVDAGDPELISLCQHQDYKCLLI
jgi:hypothetical protein